MKLIKILVEDQEQVDKFNAIIQEAEENGETGDYFTVHVSDFDPDKQVLYEVRGSKP